MCSGGTPVQLYKKKKSLNSRSTVICGNEYSTCGFYGSQELGEFVSYRIGDGE